MNTCVIKIPKLGTLILRVPLAGAIAKGVDTLLGARLLLIAPGPAEGCLEAVVREGVKKSLRLEQTTTTFCVEQNGIRYATPAAQHLRCGQLHHESRSFRET